MIVDVNLTIFSLPGNISPNARQIQWNYSFLHSTAMRILWTRAGLLGSVSMAFGSLLWSQKETASAQVGSSCVNADANPTSPYELKLVQVVFRHGARTPLKSIPDVMEVKLSCCLSSIDLILEAFYLISVLTCVCSSKAQWVPTLLEPPAHTHINYVVTDLHGGPRPPAPIEDKYRKSILTVSRCALLCMNASTGSLHWEIECVYNINSVITSLYSWVGCSYIPNSSSAFYVGYSQHLVENEWYHNNIIPYRCSWFSGIRSSVRSDLFI